MKLRGYLWSHNEQLSQRPDRNRPRETSIWNAQDFSLLGADPVIAIATLDRFSPALIGTIRVSNRRVLMGTELVRAMIVVRA